MGTSQRAAALTSSPPDLLPFKCDGAANERTRKFLLGVIQICLNYIERENDRAQKVIDFYQPDEIIKMFDFSIPDTPTELDQLVEDCRRTLAYQVKTGECWLRKIRAASEREFVRTRAEVGRAPDPIRARLVLRR